jgi:nitrate/TMAO reductase-like tetraheme cytochrome c subunit
MWRTMPPTGDAARHDYVRLPVTGRTRGIPKPKNRNMKTLFTMHGGVMACLMLAAGLSGVAAGPVPNDKCMECHGDKDLTKELPGGKEKSIFTDEKALGRSVHAKSNCADCHEGIGEDHPDDGKAVAPVACAKCHEPQSHSFGASVHGQARAHGVAEAAACASCHGTHEVLPRRDAGSKIHAGNLVKTCGGCHQEVAADVAGSVHGRAMAKGETDAATCLDCHAEHQISKLPCQCQDQQPLRAAGRPGEDV